MHWLASFAAHGGIGAVLAVISWVYVFRKREKRRRDRLCQEVIDRAWETAQPKLIAFSGRKLSQAEMDEIKERFQRQSRSNRHAVLNNSGPVVKPVDPDFLAKWKDTHEWWEVPPVTKDPTPEELSAQGEKILRNIQQINEEPFD